jgi:hypothetical protein
MTTETKDDRLLTDQEIDEFRMLDRIGGRVLVDGLQLRALVASLDRLQVLEVQAVELRQANEAMLRDSLSPTVRLDILTQAVRALVRCNPGDAARILMQLDGEASDAQR